MPLSDEERIVGAKIFQCLQCGEISKRRYAYATVMVANCGWQFAILEHFFRLAPV